MPRRNPLLVKGEIYHIFNRGVEKRTIFSDESDFLRFVKAIDYYRLENNQKLSTLIRSKIKNQTNQVLVEILGYCLMPNHFHFLLKQNQENGISNFLSKLSNSYTKYFNTKYDRVGPLFQGQFKAVKVGNDEQLVHVSRYIHLNPYMANLIKTPNSEYPWSSLENFISDEDNPLISTREVLSLFSSKDDYKQFLLDQADYAKSLDLLKHRLLD